MKRSTGEHSRVEGYTVLELLVTIAIIGILATLVIQGFKKYRRHAEKVVCISQMKTIHQALASHLADKGYWPQPQINLDNFKEEDWFAWWFVALQPYGAEAEDWLCPSDEVRQEDSKEGAQGSYMPTIFDANRFSAVRWQQPWLMERGNLHGKGPHIAMPDGSISTELQFGGSGN